MSDLAVVPRRSPVEIPASPAPAGSVLIIDDEAEIRESLRTLLELEGYSVEVAGTGEEGLIRVGQQAFDLVLLDLALPDCNGLDLLGELRRSKPGRSTPVFVVSATAGPTAPTGSR